MDNRSEVNSGLRIYDIYNKTKYLSIKHDTYFQVYENLLGQFVGRQIVFVEIGVLNGGSLFMWRDYFGPKARIIGIDLNPAAKKWQDEGFEIHIGSQADPVFWDNFFSVVGPVDIILDDGGHTNLQQVVALHQAIPHINDGGLLIVEDCHASYYREFGNPSRYSFVNFAKLIVDSVNSRHSSIKPLRNPYGDCVWSVNFFESIVAFQIDRKRCFRSKSVSNNGLSMDAADFRLSGTAEERIVDLQASLTKKLRSIPGAKAVIRKWGKLSRKAIVWLSNRRVRKYFVS